MTTTSADNDNQVEDEDCCLVYLEHLLQKHRLQKPVLWEDLDSAFNKAVTWMTDNNAFSQEKKLRQLHDSQVAAYKEAAIQNLCLWAESIPLQHIIREEPVDRESFVNRCLQGVIVTIENTMPCWNIDNAREIVLAKLENRAKQYYDAATSTTMTTLSLRVNIGGVKAMYPWIDTETTIRNPISFADFQKQLLQVACKVNPNEFISSSSTSSSILLICNGADGSLITGDAQLSSKLLECRSWLSSSKGNKKHASSLGTIYVSMGRFLESYEDSGTTTDQQVYNDNKLTCKVLLERRLSLPSSSETGDTTLSSFKQTGGGSIRFEEEGNEVSIPYSYAWLPIKAIKYHVMMSLRQNKKSSNNETNRHQTANNNDNTAAPSTSNNIGIRTSSVETTLWLQDLRLIFAGKSLQDERRLVDYGVQKGSKLNGILKTTATT